MSHTVHGLIRKAPFIKTGCGPQGDSTMFVVELSEVTKDFRTDEKFYANYKAMLFAKSPAAVNYYNKALAEGSFAVVSCEKLKVEQREHNGKTYISLMMDNPRLEGAHFDDNAAPQQQSQPMQQMQQPQRQPQAQQQYSPQQQRMQQQPAQQVQQPAQNSVATQQMHPPTNYSQPNADFDDDIPFAPIGLQHPQLLTCI